MIQKIQRLKAKKGFTLVELIVVIAIIGVLAAILIPTMLGFVDNARIQNANSTARSYADTVKSYLTTTEAAGKGVVKETGGTGALGFTIGNTAGNSPTFTQSGTTTLTVEGTDGFSKWLTGLQKHLQEQMPNAKDGAGVSIIITKGAVTAVFYSETGATAVGITDAAKSDVKDGKKGGVVVGSYPVVSSATSSS